MPLEIVHKEVIPQGLFDHRRVGWGGIFAGSFMTAAFIFLFMSIGGAIGLPSIVAINPMVPESFTGTPPSENLFWWTWVYTFVTVTACFFIGGFCTSRIARVKGTSIAGLYGLSSWAVVVVISLLMINSISTFLEQLLAGSISTASSWLVVSTLAFGALFSFMGGFAGRSQKDMESSYSEGDSQLKAVS